MTHTRTYLAALLVLGGTLIACGGDSDEPEPMRIEDLPAESLLMFGASGARPFDDSVEDLLALLPFEPLLPRVVPEDWPLATAMIIPSKAPRGKVDLEASLALTYAPEGAGEGDSQAVSEGVTVTQQKQPMPEIAAAAKETVDVNGIEGYILGAGGRDTGILMFHACDLTVTITSSTLDTDDLVALGKSLTEDCAVGEVG